MTRGAPSGPPGWARATLCGRASSPARDWRRAARGPIGRRARGALPGSGRNGPDPGTDPGAATGIAWRDVPRRATAEPVGGPRDPLPAAPNSRQGRH